MLMIKETPWYKVAWKALWIPIIAMLFVITAAVIGICHGPNKARQFLSEVW